MALDLLDPINLDWEDDMPDGETSDRPLVVAYPLKDVLDGFHNDLTKGFEKLQLGIDSANSSLAMKADKAEVETLRRRVDDLANSLAAAKGWRGGFFAAAGLAVGILGSPLIAHFVH